MKKITKIFSVFITVFLFASALVLTSSAEKASAAPAPGLSSFSILGCADQNAYDQEQYYPRQYLSDLKFPSTVYIFTNQEGYGNTTYSIDGGSYERPSSSKWYPRNGWIDAYSYGVTGWAQYDKLILSPGTHTIKAYCSNTGRGGSSRYDSITITVE